MELLQRLMRLFSRPDFRRNPARALWRRLRWRVHWRLFASHPFLVPFWGGQTIRLGHSSASLGIYLNDGFSDPWIAQHFIDFLRPGMVAFDCGAHIGEYTLLFASLVGPDGQVHAFEPDPRIFPILLDNIRRNRWPQVRANPAALGSVDGEGGFALSADPTASSLVRHTGNPGRHIVTVTIRTLDSYAKEVGLNRLDAVKIDVEGAEEEVLLGGAKTLAGLRPGLIVIECDGGRPRSVAETLGKLGYSVEVIDDRAHRFPFVVAKR